MSRGALEALARAYTEATNHLARARTLARDAECEASHIRKHCEIRYQRRVEFLNVAKLGRDEDAACEAAILAREALYAAARVADVAAGAVGGNPAKDDCRFCGCNLRSGHYGPCRDASDVHRPAPRAAGARRE